MKSNSIMNSANAFMSFNMVFHIIIKKFNGLNGEPLENLKISIHGQIRYEKNPFCFKHTWIRFNLSIFGDGQLSVHNCRHKCIGSLVCDDVGICSFRSCIYFEYENASVLSGKDRPQFLFTFVVKHRSTILNCHLRSTLMFKVESEQELPIIICAIVFLTDSLFCFESIDQCYENICSIF